jgi:hypothetical protein
MPDKNQVLNDPFELPSLEQIEEMDKQRLQAIESLEISDGKDVLQPYLCLELPSQGPIELMLCKNGSNGLRK